jgi:hypothetical protein
MQFSMLVFPAPLGPIIEVISPGSMVMLTPDRAFKPPNVSVTFSTCNVVISVKFRFFYAIKNINFIHILILGFRRPDDHFEVSLMGFFHRIEV